MACKDHPPLEAYLDNELDRSTARTVETHLDTCADCRETLTQLDALRRTLRDGALRYAAPASLRERIAGTVVVAERSAQPRWWNYAAASVIAFGAGGLSVGTWNATHGNASQQLSHDVFASHWRALAATSPVDVVSTDRHTVKPWFAGKVALAPLVQDFADRGFPLAGGRIDYVGDARVPVLVYRHGQHIVDVFVLPNDVSIAPAHEQGYDLETAKLGEQRAVIVSDMDAQEMAKFRDLLSKG
ncbi:MAG: zf-HC2 domain-containing protein [Rudaea sp.]